ncbi:chaplin [Streptomyces formicae]|uniref:Putative secreted protein n=1 Tax=Streptomyces formicae TaxID=1616117 RepID=A0A291QLV2_9ACTN|nr:chaplin [Streptomyces formicae]ATL32507.1 putative secreted protein [Streptomyces formicae]
MRIRTALAAASLATAALLGGAGAAVADDGPGADAVGVAENSPGVVSGNVLQAPIDLPLNACGNSVDIIGLLNPAFGNSCR